MKKSVYVLNAVSLSQPICPIHAWLSQRVSGLLALPRTVLLSESWSSWRGLLPHSSPSQYTGSPPLKTISYGRKDIIHFFKLVLFQSYNFMHNFLRFPAPPSSALSIWFKDHSSKSKRKQTNKNILNNKCINKNNSKQKYRGKKWVVVGKGSWRWICVVV